MSDQSITCIYCGSATHSSSRCPYAARLDLRLPVEQLLANYAHLGIGRRRVNELTGIPMSKIGQYTDIRWPTGRRRSREASHV